MKEQILERIRQKWQVEFEPLSVDGRTYEILGIANMPAYLDTLVAKGSLKDPLRTLPLWAKAWPGAIVLGRFLRKYEGKRLLELGCGLGILSLIASQYNFQKIVATDISRDALDFARFHMLHNGVADKVEVKYLDVASRGKPEDLFDLIAASELLYLDDLHRPILHFLQRHLSGKAFFCTDLKRYKPRFNKLAAKTFHVTEGCIGVKSSDGNGEDRRIYNITILEKK